MKPKFILETFRTVEVFLNVDKTAMQSYYIFVLGIFFYINDHSLPTSASPFAVLLFLPECVRDFKVLAWAISMGSIASNKDKTKLNDRDEMKNECLYRTMSTIWPLRAIWPSLKTSCNALQSIHSGPTKQHKRKRILTEKKFLKEWLNVRAKWIFLQFVASSSDPLCVQWVYAAFTISGKHHTLNENCDRAAWPTDFPENVYYIHFCTLQHSI